MSCPGKDWLYPPMRLQTFPSSFDLKYHPAKRTLALAWPFLKVIPTLIHDADSFATVTSEEHWLPWIFTRPKFEGTAHPVFINCLWEISYTPTHTL